MRRAIGSPHRRFAPACLLVVCLLCWSASCSRDEPVQTSDAPPSAQDAIRTAQAANDQLLNYAPPFATLGAIEQKPYRCATQNGCAPQEQYVERELTPKGATNAQIAKSYIEETAKAGWRIEGAFCDETKNEYVVLASKRPNASKAYPGRFELFAKDTSRLRITMPAFGAETSFVLVPDASNYPSGICPGTITNQVDAARKATDKGPPTTLPSGSVPAGAGTTAAPRP